MSSKIIDVRSKVFQWIDDTKTPHGNFCTNATDILPSQTSSDTMDSFKFLQWLVVEVETSDGLVGIGNAALSPIPTKSVIDEYLKPLLIGESPFDYEYLWQKMYRKTLAFGRKGIGMTAISAVDLAIWDVIGKAYKQPVFRLLGGRTKDKIPVYASSLYSQSIDTLQQEAQNYLDEGYTSMKMRFGWGPMSGAAGMQKNIELVRAIREVVGDSVDIMGDAYMGWTLDYAKRMLPLLADYNMRWVEEPVIADDIDGYAELKAMNIMPIAGGEHEFTVYGFRQLLEKRAIDVIQYDVNRVGGITQAQKIAALGDAFSIPVIPHAGQMHNYHLVMANLNAPIAEFFPKCPVEIGNELFWYVFDGEPVPENGFIDLDDNTPGLGLSISDKYLDSFKIIE